MTACATSMGPASPGRVPPRARRGYETAGGTNYGVPTWPDDFLDPNSGGAPAPATPSPSTQENNPSDPDSRRTATTTTSGDSTPLVRAVAAFLARLRTQLASYRV